MDDKSDFEQKIREILSKFFGEEGVSKLPRAQEIMDKITESISRQLTPERQEKLAALGITLEKAVESLARGALNAVIAAGKAAERASEKL